MYVVQLHFKREFAIRAIAKIVQLPVFAVENIINNEIKGIKEAKILEQKLDARDIDADKTGFNLPTPEQIYVYWLSEGFCPRFQVSDHFGVSEQFVKNSIAAYSRSQDRTMPTGGRSLYI